MGLRNGILIRIRKKHIRIGNKFDCVEGVRKKERKKYLPQSVFGSMPSAQSHVTRLLRCLEDIGFFRAFPTLVEGHQ